VHRDKHQCKERGVLAFSEALTSEESPVAPTPLQNSSRVRACARWPNHHQHDAWALRPQALCLLLRKKLRASRAKTAPCAWNTHASHFASMSVLDLSHTHSLARSTPVFVFQKNKTLSSLFFFHPPHKNWSVQLNAFFHVSQENQAVLKEYTALRSEKEALEQQLQQAQQNALEYAQMAAAILSENATLRVENERLAAVTTAGAVPPPSPPPQQQQLQAAQAQQLAQLQAQLAQAAARERDFAREREQAAAAQQNAAAEVSRLNAQIAALQLQLQDAQAKSRDAAAARGEEEKKLRERSEKAEADCVALRRELEEQKARSENLEKANRAIKEKVERLVASLKGSGWTPPAGMAAAAPTATASPTSAPH